MYIKSSAASDFPRAMMNQAKTVCFIGSGMENRVSTTNGLENQRQGAPIDEISNTPGVLSHDLFGEPKCHFVENGEIFKMCYKGPAKGFDETVSV